VASQNCVVPVEEATQDPAASSGLAGEELGDPEGVRAEDAVPGIGFAQSSGVEPEWHPPGNSVTLEGETPLGSDLWGADGGFVSPDEAVSDAASLESGEPAAAPTTVGADEITDFQIAALLRAAASRVVGRAPLGLPPQLSAAATSGGDGSSGWRVPSSPAPTEPMELDSHTAGWGRGEGAMEEAGGIEPAGPSRIPSPADIRVEEGGAPLWAPGCADGPAGMQASELNPARSQTLAQIWDGENRNSTVAPR
jgi:hypothetical protein